MRTLLVFLLVALGPAASLRGDEFLHPTYSELGAAERRALEDLIDDLDHPEPAVRNLVIRQLEAIGRPAVEALKRHIADNSSPQRVSLSCMGLGATRQPSAQFFVERLLMSGEAQQDKVRGALLGMTQGAERLLGEPAEMLRELSIDASQHTVKRLAALVAASRGVVGLSAILGPRIRRESYAPLAASYLLALAESGEPQAASPLARELRNSNQLVRRAATYACGRLGDPELLDALLKLRPRSPREVGEFCVALGAYADPRVVARLEQLMAREGDAAASAAFSLATIATPEALSLLRRVLEGEFTDAARARAALAVTELTDQSFVDELRRLAESRDPRLRCNALLALARLRDEVAAATFAEKLDKIRDPLTLELALLLCCTAGVPHPWQAVPEARWRGRVGALASLSSEVDSGRRDPRLFDRIVLVHMERLLAHRSLQRDQVRRRLVLEALELDDLLVLLNTDLQGQDQGSDSLFPKPQSLAASTGLDGGFNFGGGSSGGSSDGGGDQGGGDSEGSGGGDGSGGEGSGGDGTGGEGDGGGGSDGGDSGAPPPATDAGGGSSGMLGGLRSSRGRGRVLRQSFEADLLFWLRDYPLFPGSDPFDIR